MTGPLLDVREVRKVYRRRGLIAAPRLPAVDGVSLTLSAGTPEIFAIIGESGSGKTTLARMILGMIAPSSGSIWFAGTNLAAIRGRARRIAFMGRVQPIFQNPFEAFNPLKRVDRYLFATARSFANAGTVADMERACDSALHQVGLSLREIAGRFPHELSGGQLQRVAIARALVSRPALIVADEPVSMIDASLRMSVVDLFRTLRDTLDVSIIYITHDLATAYSLSDRIMIMREGREVEAGDARTVLDNPRHPYSILLKDSVLQIPPPNG